MMLRRSMVLLLLAACSSPAEPELLLPDVVSVDWSARYNASEDGLGAWVPIDLMVYDGETGLPLPGVALVASVEHDGTWVIPESARLLAPTAASSMPDRVMTLWDARHDRYVHLDASLDDVSVGAQSVVTDASGVARVSLFVDRFPVRGDQFADVAVVVSAASPTLPLEGTVLLQPR